MTTFPTRCGYVWGRGNADHIDFTHTCEEPPGHSNAHRCRCGMQIRLSAPIEPDLAHQNVWLTLGPLGVLDHLTVRAARDLIERIVAVVRASDAADRREG